jgi:hypothetical protein
MPFPILTASRPDKHTDRVGWNESWEHDLWFNYSHFKAAFPTKELKNHKLSASILEPQNREICILQQDLYDLTIEKIATDDFDKKWKKLKQAEREVHVLEGLYKVSCCGQGVEEYRGWCPEMAID